VAAAGAWTPVDSLRTKILNGQFDMDSDTFKCALFLSTSNISTSSTTYAGLTNQHANANGYTTGGITVSPLVLAGTTSVTVKFGTNPSWTATGGSIVARYAVLYESAGDVLAFCLLDSTPADVVTTTGNVFTVDSTTNPVVILA
jgi:hypothetical protein